MRMCTDSKGRMTLNAVNETEWKLARPPRSQFPQRFARNQVMQMRSREDMMDSSVTYVSLQAQMELSPCNLSFLWAMYHICSFYTVGFSLFAEAEESENGGSIGEMLDFVLYWTLTNVEHMQDKEDSREVMFYTDYVKQLPRSSSEKLEQGQICHVLCSAMQFGPLDRLRIEKVEVKQELKKSENGKERVGWRTPASDWSELDLLSYTREVGTYNQGPTSLVSEHTGDSEEDCHF